MEHGLEVIDKGHTTVSHPAPLLFVHGAWHGAWCWDEHFLGYFAEKGYHAVAVSLPGRGGSTRPASLRTSMADLVSDVASVADGLPSPPVAIAHSMGGTVVQHFLGSHAVPGGILLASCPPAGSFRYVVRQFKRYPWQMTQSFITGKSPPRGFTTAYVRENFFSAQTPEEEVVRYVVRLDVERTSKSAFDQLFLNRPKPKRVAVPMLILGAECDGSVTGAEVRATAEAYRTKAEFFPGMGHDMMLEPGWEAVAERIHTWLGGRGL